MAKRTGFTKIHAQKALQVQPGFSPGSELTAEERLSRLHQNYETDFQVLITDCQTNLERWTARKHWADQLVKESKAYAEAHGLPRQTRFEILASHTDYCRDEEALSKSTRKALRSIGRVLREVRQRQLETVQQAKLDLHLEKSQLLIEAAQAPRINMHWTNLEGLLTTPYQQRAAVRAFTAEEQQLGGQPVSEERRGKLHPKPKPKARGKRLAGTSTLADAAAAVATPPVKK